MKKTSLILALGTALLCFVSTSCIVRQYPASKRTVSVRGTGSIPVEADRAIIVLSVITTAKDAGTAASQNADKMNKVQDAVIAAGGSRENISTENYTIYQEYDYVKDRRVPGEYRVSNQIKVYLKDKSLASTVIDAAIKAGANSLSSLSFSVSNPELAIKQARTLAVQNAQEAANLIAGTTGSELGKVLKIDEVNNDYAAPMAKIYGNTMYESAATADSETPVQSGKINFTVTVNATFELK